MPRLVRVTSESLEGYTLYQNKSESYQTFNDSSEPHRFTSEDAPLIGCTDNRLTNPTVTQVTLAELDTMWFLAAGCRPIEIPSCQLGDLNLINSQPNPPRYTVVFPGQYTYKVRPGNTVRQSIDFYKVVPALTVTMVT